MNPSLETQLSHLDEDLKISIYQKYLRHIFHKIAFQLLSILIYTNGFYSNTIFPIVVNPVYPFLTVFSLQWYNHFSRIEYLFFLYLARLYHIGVIIHKESFLLHLRAVQEDREHKNGYWRVPIHPYFIRWLERFDTLNNWISKTSEFSEDYFLVTFHSDYRLKTLEDSEENMHYDFPLQFTQSQTINELGENPIYHFHDSYTWYLSEQPWSFYPDWKNAVTILAQLNGLDPETLNPSYLRPRTYHGWDDPIFPEDYTARCKYLLSKYKSAFSGYPNWDL